jgi:hypothetical protein
MTRPPTELSPAARARSARAPEDSKLSLRGGRRLARAPLVPRSLLLPAPRANRSAHHRSGRLNALNCKRQLRTSCRLVDGGARRRAGDRGERDDGNKMPRQLVAAVQREAMTGDLSG